MSTEKTLWAVNIPHEPDADDVLYAAIDKPHAEQIVQRLHSEIEVAYPTFGECMKDSINIAKWCRSPAEHAASLSEKWWEHTSFNKSVEGHD